MLDAVDDTRIAIWKHKCAALEGTINEQAAAHTAKIATMQLELKATPAASGAPATAVARDAIAAEVWR